MRADEVRVMKDLAFGIAVSMLVSTASGAVAAEAPKPIVLSGPAAVAWQHGPSNLPAGSRIAVLSGDPTKPGPFVLRVEFPANTLVAQHRHATTENLTVISGSFEHGIGEKVDRAHERLMEPGGFLFLPGNVPHYLRTLQSKTVVQVTGMGPFGLHYVDNADKIAAKHHST